MKKPKIPYPLPENIKAKFLAELGSIQDDPNQCWLWPRCTGVGDPYICFYGKMYSAAQVSYLHWKGEIPDGQKVAHTCKNRPCVNPDHLILGQPGTTNKLNLRERFFAKTEREDFIRPGQSIPCLLWTGTRCLGGYGKVYKNRKRHQATHIAILLESNKLVPEDKDVLHSCDNPPCVEFTHLKIGTTAENVADRVQKKRTASGNRHGTHTKPESVPRGERHGMSVFTEGEVILIRKTYDQHKSIRGVVEALTRHLNKKHYAVWCIAKRKTWISVNDDAHPEIQPLLLEELKKHFKKWPTGDDHKLTKLSDLQVREIRWLATQNLGRRGSHQALASRYNVSRSLISAIYSRKNRSSVPDNFEELDALSPLFPDGDGR